MLKNFCKTLILSSLSICASCASSEQEFFLTCTSPSGIQSENALFYQDIDAVLKEEKSQLRINLEIKKLPQGSEIQALQAGTIDIGLISPQDLLKIASTQKEKALLDPFVNPANHEVDTIFELDSYVHIHQKEFHALLKKCHLVMVGKPLFHGYRNLHLISHKEKVNSLADIQKLHLRLRVPDKISWSSLQAFFQASELVEVKSPDLQAALEKKQFDAFDIPYADLKNKGLTKFITQTVLTHHLIGALFVVMSEKKYNELLDGQQKKLSSAIDNAVDKNNARKLKSEQQMCEELKKLGVVVSSMNH